MPVKSSHRVCGDPYFHSKCLHISSNSRLCNIFHRMPSLTANCPDGPILIFHPHRMLNLLRVFFSIFELLLSWKSVIEKVCLDGCIMDTTGVYYASLLSMSMIEKSTTNKRIHIKSHSMNAFRFNHQMENLLFAKCVWKCAFRCRKNWWKIIIDETDIKVHSPDSQVT